MNFNWRYALFILIVVPILIYIGKYLTVTPLYITAILVSIVVAMITFQKPENGLLVIVFSMMLSPEIMVANVPGRAVTVRVDDILILVIFLAWLAHTAVDKNWKGFVKTPLDTPLLLLSVLYIGSTLFNVIGGDVNPIKGFFYSLKYIEYFILYWMVVNIADTESIPRFLIAGLITCIAVTLFAYTIFPTGQRVYAPFDAEGGEPASMAGYYLVIFSVLFGFLLHAESVKTRVLYLAMVLFIFLPFVKTLSRASYLAFLPLVVSLITLTKRGKLFFGMMVAFGIVIFPVLFGGIFNDMASRVRYTFTGTYSEAYSKYTFNVGGKKVTDQSALERLGRWSYLVEKNFTRNIFTILFGNGVTGIRFVEGQFFLLLGELGILGVIFFYWAMFLIFKYSYRIYKFSTTAIAQSLSLSLFCCLVSLSFQAITTNTFIIVRIMEPFWFLVGLVMIPSTSQDIIYSDNISKAAYFKGG